MSKTPIDYQKSIIYKIFCRDVSITDCYVGSTTNLSRRKPAHKTRCNNKRGKHDNLNVYQVIRGHGGWENFSVIVVEDFPCDSKNQLHTRERFHIEDLHATLNKCIPTRTQKEYQQTNSEKIKEYYTEYKKENPEKIKERDKAYQKENAEHIRSRKKAYNSEKIPCPHCNKIFSKGSMTCHTRRKHTE